jgi:hypothetical protein
MLQRSLKDVAFLTETLMSRYLRAGSYKAVARPPSPEQTTRLHFSYDGTTPSGSGPWRRPSGTNQRVGYQTFRWGGKVPEGGKEPGQRFQRTLGNCWRHRDPAVSILAHELEEIHEQLA